MHEVIHVSFGFNNIKKLLIVINEAKTPFKRYVIAQYLQKNTKNKKTQTDTAVVHAPKSDFLPEIILFNKNYFSNLKKYSEKSWIS